MDEHLTEADAEHQKPVTLLEELQIEAALVPSRRGQLYALAAAEIRRLQGERDVMVSVLRECEGIIRTLPEPESVDEEESLRMLLRAIKRITLLGQADDRELAQCSFL